jgi:hypothetical protein
MGRLPPPMPRIIAFRAAESCSQSSERCGLCFNMRHGRPRVASVGRGERRQGAGRAEASAGGGRVQRRAETSRTWSAMFWSSITPQRPPCSSCRRRRRRPKTLRRRVAAIRPTTVTVATPQLARRTQGLRRARPGRRFSAPRCKVRRTPPRWPTGALTFAHGSDAAPSRLAASSASRLPAAAGDKGGPGPGARSDGIGRWRHEAARG